MVAGAVAGVGLGIVGFTGCGSADQDGRAVSQSRPPATAGVVRSERFGVPQGWSHDERGARAAAVSAVALTGDVARAGFITRRDMISALASTRFAPRLVRSSAEQLEELLHGLADDGVSTEALLFRELPLTARVVHVDERTAQVMVWAVLVAGVPERRKPPLQLWRTVIVDLVWERGDWRVDEWATTAGPSPALAADARIATVADLSGVTSWPPAGAG